MRPRAGAAGWRCPPSGLGSLAPEPGVAALHIALFAARPGRWLHPALQFVDHGGLAVDHRAGVGGVPLQLRAQPVVVGAQAPCLLVHLAQLRIDLAEPGLGTPGPDLLGSIRPGDLGLNAAPGAPGPCRRPFRARPPPRPAEPPR